MRCDAIRFDLIGLLKNIVAGQAVDMALFPRLDLVYDDFFNLFSLFFFERHVLA